MEQMHKYYPIAQDNEKSGREEYPDAERKKNIPMVSVVVTLCNCGSFVRNFLFMLRNQTFTKFEVICIVPGCADNTVTEVRNFCKEDDRFQYKVCNYPDPGTAGNEGLDMARGKYICFPDICNQYSSDYLMKLFKASESYDADISVCSSAMFSGKTIKSRMILELEGLSEGKVYSVKNTKHILHKIDAQISGMLFSRDFLKKNELRFSGTKAFTDLFFSKASIVCADSIVIIHGNLVSNSKLIDRNFASSSKEKESHAALGELKKLYQWLENHDLLMYSRSDYLELFDNTAYTEMKNGVTGLFAKEMARALNCDEPWKKLNSNQIKKILVKSLGDKGADLINKESLVRFSRDLDDPESESPWKTEYKKARESVYSNAAHLENTGKASGQPGITVVIPMYNCADFVDGVLSMFAAQSFTDFEVICVIDGAADDTEEKVRTFCEKDPRFSFVVQENAGAGAARNRGLDLARGKYIIFSDADDEYFPDYLKIFYETAIMHDAQIVISRIARKNYKTNIETIHGFDEKKFHEDIPYSHWEIDNLFGAFSGTVNSKLYNTAFLKNNGITFPKIKCAEDACFLCCALCLSDKILVVNDVPLRYRMHINPECASDKRNHWQHQAVDQLRTIYRWIKAHSLSDIHMEDYMKKVNGSIQYTGKYVISSRYISECAHMLNAEEPFSTMTVEDILFYLCEGLLAIKASLKVKEISMKIALHLIKFDDQLSDKLEYYKRRVRIAELLRQTSKETYGRDFLSPKVFKRIGWILLVRFIQEKNLHNAPWQML